MIISLIITKLLEYVFKTDNRRTIKISDSRKRKPIFYFTLASGHDFVSMVLVDFE